MPSLLDPGEVRRGGYDLYPYIATIAYSRRLEFRVFAMRALYHAGLIMMDPWLSKFQQHADMRRSIPRHIAQEIISTI
ncbi:hypothetical protein ACLOJK_037602 [Asimina triloba]